MSAIRGIIRKGQVIMTEPADLPDETEVEIVPVRLTGPVGDEGTMGPDEIARTLAVIEEIEPFEMTDGERAANSAGRITSGSFEEEYRKIGWWKGPYATPEARAQVRDFWLRQGGPGLRWLAGRLRQEWHIDALEGVATLLAGAGEAAIPPILDELERQPTGDQAAALLRALAWIGEDGVEAQASLTTRLEGVLASFLQHDDAGPREWAARSARLLPREQVAGLLRERLEAEPDADVRRAMDEIIGVDAAGRG